MIDTQSEAWQALEPKLNEMLESAKECCISATIDQRQADFQRGIAYAVKTVIEFAAGGGAPKANVTPFEI